jgi:hypothetical protein
MSADRIPLTRADFEVLAAWLDTAELPHPFRTFPPIQCHSAERTLGILRANLRMGPSGPNWTRAVEELRWLAKRYGTPEARIAAHADELHESVPPPFRARVEPTYPPSWQPG